MGPVGGAPYTSVGTRWNGGARRIRPARGQSLVEFALVLPLFLLLVFAIVEYSLINTAIGAYNFGAKDGARLGAILGPTASDADTQIQNLIDAHVLSFGLAQPVELDIFEATESGTYDPANPPAHQDVYTFSNGAWSLASHSWLPGLSGDCGTSVVCRNDQLVSQDYLGVRIVYKYTYVTAFISTLGATLTLSALSVQRIEPQEIYHQPAPGAGASIAALDPPLPQAPLLSFAALMPLWAFPRRRAYGPGRPNGKERGE